MSLPPQITAHLPELLPGSVALTGAGPGDPTLLTLRALHVLGQADVILYDALVDETVLGLARPEATLEYVGKKAGRPSCSQALICRRLVNHARAGRRVVRLKGGDPFVFGRGAEELLALRDAGIPTLVVPGVTAGIGGIAAAGIPLTHRPCNSGAIFLTGSDRRGALPELDWGALARTRLPLVVYMGFRHRRALAGELLEGGALPSTPVAIVFGATSGAGTVRELSLAQLATDEASGPAGLPAILVIGDTVKLRHELAPLPRDAAATQPPSLARTA